MAGLRVDEPGGARLGQCGPTLFKQAIEHCRLQERVQPWRVFCPLRLSAWEQALEPGLTWNFGDETRAIHLWNELWRRAGQPKDIPYPAGCLYDSLRRRFLGTAQESTMVRLAAPSEAS